MLDIKTTHRLAGDPDYRAYVGAPENYDLLSATQFNLLTLLGLREFHTVLDIGCGSLRVGKLLIPYLLPGNYYGIEPQQWLIDEGVKKELGREILHIKSPHFSNDDDFNLSVFNRQFDFLLAQSIFSHTSIKQLRKCMTEARRVMHSRSIFLATYLPGEENYQGNTWAYPECITFTPEFMEGVIHDVGLAVLPLDWPHPGDQKWMVITEEQNIENIQKVMSFPGMHILEDKIRQQQERLKKFESNPLIKFGLRLYRFIRRG